MSLSHGDVGCSAVCDCGISGYNHLLFTLLFAVFAYLIILDSWCSLQVVLGNISWDQSNLAESAQFKRMHFWPCEHCA